MATMTNESGLRAITMQDVRLAVGEGSMKPADVLAGCNAELARRKALISPAGEVAFKKGYAEGYEDCDHGLDYDPDRAWSAAPRGMEG